MKKSIRPNRLFALAIGLLMVIAAAPVCIQARIMYGVSRFSNELVMLGSGGNSVIGPVSGLQSGENVTGLDFRPATGQLYALAGPGRLYIIDRYTAVATLVGTLNVSLSGTRFGFDFEPTTDRIRIVSNAGDNFSVNPNDATVTVQTPLNPGIAQGIGAAYTNSRKGATSTLLYIFNVRDNTINTMTPPSGGTLTQVPGTIGQSVDIEGLDIDPFDGTAICTFYTGAGEAPGGYGTFNLQTGQRGPFQIVPGQLMLDSIAIMPGTARAAKVDFDRDKKSDFSVFRPSTNDWFANRSSNNTFFAARFGTAGDVLTPGDYDGDERTDVAVWRPSTGYFYVLRSLDGVVQYFRFGQNGDEPVVHDFDGDGKTDFSVARRTGGQLIWYKINSSNGAFSGTQWGLDSDTLAPADYDGDGTCDLAVRRGRRPQQAVFYILASTAGYYVVNWGFGTDVIVPGDYDADGKADVAVLRPETPYKWYILTSSNNGFLAYSFGASPHIPTPGDFDGDGQTDPTVFVPAEGNFYSRRSSSNTVSAFHFGQNGDVPLAQIDSP